MSSHTKGPWKVEKMPDDGGEFSIFSNTGIYVALTVGGTDSEEANARLIAAAPDLLEALEQLFRIGDVYRSAIEHDAYGEYGSKMDLEQWTDLAKAAIAKARGEK